MNKSELVNLIAEKTGETKAKSSDFLEAFIGSVKETLTSGEDITLVGFASLSAVARKERVGRNPQTGAALKIPAHTVVKFNAGKDLRDAVAHAKTGKKTAKVKAKAVVKVVAKAPVKAVTKAVTKAPVKSKVVAKIASKAVAKAPAKAVAKSKKK